MSLGRYALGAACLAGRDRARWCWRGHDPPALAGRLDRGARPARRDRDRAGDADRDPRAARDASAGSSSGRSSRGVRRRLGGACSPLASATLARARRRPRRRDRTRRRGDRGRGHRGHGAAEWSAPTLQSYDVGIRTFDSLWYHLPWAASFAQTGHITPAAVHRHRVPDGVLSGHRRDAARPRDRAAGPRHPVAGR